MKKGANVFSYMEIPVNSTAVLRPVTTDTAVDTALLLVNMASTVSYTEAFSWSRKAVLVNGVGKRRPECKKNVLNGTSAEKKDKEVPCSK